MASLMWLLAAPSFYLVLATLGMLQFSVLLNALASLSHAMDRGSPALEPLAPVVKAYTRFLDGVFGPAYKYTPSPTHVCLVSVRLRLLSRCCDGSDHHCDESASRSASAPVLLSTCFTHTPPKTAPPRSSSAGLATGGSHAGDHCRVRSAVARLESQRARDWVESFDYSMEMWSRDPLMCGVSVVGSCDPCTVTIITGFSCMLRGGQEF